MSAWLLPAMTFYRAADRILDTARLAGAQLVDQVHIDRFVRDGRKLRNSRRESGDRQACGGHVRVAGDDMRQNFRNAVDGIDNKFDAEFSRECRDEIEFRSRTDLPGR